MLFQIDIRIKWLIKPNDPVFLLPPLLISELVQMHLSAFHLCPNGPGEAHGRAWAEKQLSVISDKSEDKMVDIAK